MLGKSAQKAQKLVSKIYTKIKKEPDGLGGEAEGSVKTGGEAEGSVKTGGEAEGSPKVGEEGAVGKGKIRNILIIGCTGSGKSTLSNVLCDTNEFKEGTYSVDNIKDFHFTWEGKDYCVVDTSTSLS